MNGGGESGERGLEKEYRDDVDTTTTMMLESMIRETTKMSGTTREEGGRGGRAS